MFLKDAGRLGTPDHLFGLAGECALKAVLCGHGLIQGLNPRKRFRVHIDKLWNEFNSQIQGRGMAPLNASCPFVDWKIEHRYKEDSFFTAARVDRHREGASQAMQILQSAQQGGLVT